jgi:uncharacterized protein YutE (UPF0331/DUF86 family)
LVDPDIVLAKATAVEKHLKRIQERSAVSLDVFKQDKDQQDIMLFNLQMAIQNSVDLASRIVSEEALGVPAGASEVFYLLEENGYLDAQLTEKMVKAVGFKNLIVHEYTRLDLKQVLQIAQKDISDLKGFLQSIFTKLGIG